MSQHRDAYLKEQEEIAAAREKQIAENLRIIDEQNRSKPVPSPADIRKATGLPPREEDSIEEEVVVEIKPPADDNKSADDSKSGDDKIDKTSTAEHQSGGTYKTRDAKPKR